MRGRAKRFLVPAAALVGLVLFAAACGGPNTADAGSGLSVAIASPANGATVAGSFTVRLDASVPLGDPSTGRHHVHLCFDGNDCGSEYTLVYGDSIPVSDLTPGTHEIEASLRNADHSDAGADIATITVTVGAAGASSGTTRDSTGSGSGLGY